MNMNLVTLKICDKTTLLQACHLLHDAELDLSSVTFDEVAGNWRGIFTRCFFHDENLICEGPWLIFMRRVTFPLAETVLELSGITSYVVRGSSRSGMYSFLWCKPVRDSYQFDFAAPIKLIFSFRDEPQGELHDMKLLEQTDSIWESRNPFRRQ